MRDPGCLGAPPAARGGTPKHAPPGRRLSIDVQFWASREDLLGSVPPAARLFPTPPIPTLQLQGLWSQDAPAPLEPGLL